MNEKQAKDQGTDELERKCATATQSTLPPPDEVMRRIDACRDELAALRRLHRASVAARQADEARRRREADSIARVEAGQGDNNGL